MNSSHNTPTHEELPSAPPCLCNMETLTALPPAQTWQNKPSYPGISFITVHDPQGRTDPSRKKAVRSQAAVAASYQLALEREAQEKESSKSDSPPAPTKAKKRRRRRKRQFTWTVESDGLELVQSAQYRGSKELLHPTPYMVEQIAQLFRPKGGALGEGRIDPFRTYPVWDPSFPELVDHCKCFVQSILHCKACH